MQQTTLKTSHKQ